MNTHDNNQSRQRIVALKPQQPVGGAIIDAQGQEVPITEYMIQRACRELDKHWSLPKRA
jgi:hypothetical protein